MIKNKNLSLKPVIDLDGPQGNAFYLLGQAQAFANQLKWPKEELAKVLIEMKSSNYENLIEVFDKNFGEYVDLERSERN